MLFVCWMKPLPNLNCRGSTRKSPISTVHPVFQALRTSSRPRYLLSPYSGIVLQVYTMEETQMPPMDQTDQQRSLPSGAPSGYTPFPTEYILPSLLPDHLKIGMPCESGVPFSSSDGRRRIRLYHFVSPGLKSHLQSQLYQQAHRLINPPPGALLRQSRTIKYPMPP